jgi:signal transduction histidine kinase
MPGLRDRISPILAAGLVVVVAASVVVLLRVANNQGTDALEKAKLGQVEATANSFNARISAQLGAIAGLGATPWELKPGSAKDAALLHTFDIDPNAKSGFFLIDAQDRITSGILLRPGRLGSRFAPAGWAKTKATLAASPIAILPVTPSGVTTELPSYTFVVAIRGATPNSLRGALVGEQALTSDSPFQQEIAQLADRKASTAAWFFVDSGGSIVATTHASSLGKRVEDQRYLTTRPGLTDIGPRIVVTADVPALGWRVVFRQDRSQFVSALTGPLQTAGLILVLLLLGVGLTAVVALVRRLREAREQERRLRELTRSQAEFISVVSHELRTPVAGVLGFLQTTVDHWSSLSDADRLNTVRRAVTNARRLQAMTRDVLDTESIESGRLGYAFQRIDLGQELRTAVEGSGGADATHPITLTPPLSPVFVDADPDRLQQVMSNLLENARKNTPPAEPIEVETEVVDGPEPLVRVSVIDRGPGVDADSVVRIFDKFVRGNDSSVTGTGLGLYIVRKIVEAHHGRIWCESVPGNRTAFTFELPIARKDVTIPEPRGLEPSLQYGQTHG